MQHPVFPPFHQNFALVAIITNTVSKTSRPLTGCLNGLKVLAERLLFTVILVLLSPGNESEEGNNRENANELLIMQFHVGEWGGPINRNNVEFFGIIHGAQHQ